MRSTLLIVLLVLWLLGVVTSYTPGGFIHLLLVVAMITVLLRVIRGRNPLRGWSAERPVARDVARDVVALPRAS